MTTIAVRHAAEPRIDRKAVLYTLRGWGCWLSLAIAAAYTALMASSANTQVYAWCYGPAFILGALTLFAWRYQDARRKTTGRSHVAYQGPAFFVGATLVSALIGLVASVAYTSARLNAPVDYAETVGHAPGYSWDAVAAGYWACGELARGADPEDVVARLMTKGDPQGNLYTALQAGKVVDNAPILCPNVTR